MGEGVARLCHHASAYLNQHDARIVRLGIQLEIHCGVHEELGGRLDLSEKGE